MIGYRKKKETSFDLVRNWKRGNELNVGRDTKKKKKERKEKKLDDLAVTRKDICLASRRRLAYALFESLLPRIHAPVT